jgi:hypothetical protein
MKSIILFVFASLLSLSAGAQSIGWEDRIAASFYSRVSTPGYFDCCIKTGKKKRLVVYVDMPDNVFFRDDFLIKTYSEQVFDSVMVEEVARKAEAQYLKKFSKKKRASFARTCYSTQLSISMIDDLTDGCVFIKGQLMMVFTFQ